MNSRKTTAVNTTMVSGLLLVAGCGGSYSEPPPVEQTGFLTLAVSDGPVHEAEKVCITFESVEFKPADDDQSFTIFLDPPEKIDLLDFQGANAAPILEREEVPAGAYDWVRLGVDASLGSNGGMGDTSGDACDGEASYLVMVGGSVHSIFIPSSDQTGLKLVAGFTVPVNGLVNVTADWDLMKSVTAPPGLSPDVIVKPTIRLVDNVDVGTLGGTVADVLATAVDCEPSVFVFDDGVTPNAIDTDVDDPEDPVATTMVDAQMNSDGTTTFHYEIGFLLAGSYEAAFTCDGMNFEPAEGKAADIRAGQETTINFP